MKNEIVFEINDQRLSLYNTDLSIWRISHHVINSLKISDSGSNRILGINYEDSNLTEFIQTQSFRKERDSFGTATVCYLNAVLPKYDLGILYPSGYDYNSIEQVINKCSEMPLLILLDSTTYYTLFEDKSVGKICEYKSLERKSIFRVNNNET